MPLACHELVQINEFIREINQNIDQKLDPKEVIGKCLILKEKLISQMDLIDKELEKTDFLPNGTEVAAKLLINDSLNWILAQIIEYNEDSKLYLIEDVEFDEFTNDKVKYFVEASHIVPLEENNEEFQVKSQVLALFPDSTCFYKAVVILPPSKMQNTDEYLVEFEDDFVNDQLVQRNIIRKYVVNMF